MSGNETAPPAGPTATAPPMVGHHVGPASALPTIIILLVVLGVLITIVLILVPSCLFNRQPSSGQRQRGLDDAGDEEQAIDPVAIQERLEHIDRSLITKDVAAYAEVTNRTSRDEKRDGIAWFATSDCQICMEPFLVGERAAWSITGCDHVYHYSCIRSWLSKKSDCPSCRQAMLPTTDFSTIDNGDAVEAQRRKRQRTTLFCATDRGFCQADHCRDPVKTDELTTNEAATSAGWQR